MLPTPREEKKDGDDGDNGGDGDDGNRDDDANDGDDAKYGDDRDDDGKDGDDGDDDSDRIARFGFRADRATTVKGDMTAVLYLRVISDDRSEGPLDAKVQVEVLRCGTDRDNCKTLASARFHAVTAEQGSWPVLDEQSFQPYKVPLGPTEAKLKPGERLELRVTVVSDGGRDVVIAFDAASTPSGLYLS